MANIERKVDQILTISDSKEQSDRLFALIDEVSSGQVGAQCCTLFNRMLQADFTQHQSRSCLVHFAENCKSMAKDALVEVCTHSIAEIKDKGGVYDEVDYIMKTELFDYYSGCAEFLDAAQILAAVNVESPNKVLTATEKVDLLIKVAECYLMLKETIEAEVFTNKASQYMNDVDSSNLPLQLRYRAVVAQVYDGNRKFLEASLKYYELSKFTDSGIVAEDLLQLLGKATTCAVLSKTGPQRTRVLGLLYNDARLPQLDDTPPFCSHSNVLRKMFREFILQADELVQFEDSLEVHQRAITADNGLTIMQKSIMEHNMIATSRMYANIRLTELQLVLRLESPQHTEKVASKMIAEGRLAGSIDQTEGILTFADAANGESGLSGTDPTAVQVCALVDECASRAERLMTDQ